MSLNDSHIRWMFAAKRAARTAKHADLETIFYAALLVWFFAYVTIRIVWF